MFPPPPFPLCASLREPTASALRGATLSTRIDKDISLLVPLRFVRQLRTQTAQSLVLSVKLGVRFLAAVAARVPSLKSHIPFISYTAIYAVRKLAIFSSELISTHFLPFEAIFSPTSDCNSLYKRPTMSRSFLATRQSSCEAR